MEKTFFEKIIKFIEVLASVCTITGASIWGIVVYINSEKEESKYLLEVSEDEVTNENIVDFTQEMAKDETKDLFIDTVNNFEIVNYSLNANVQDEKNMELINVEDEVTRIRKYYNVIQEQKENPQQHSVNKNIKVYYVDDNVVSIEVASAYNNVDYSRIYYFDDEGKLFFVFVFDKKKENRLYFKNDILIRYIDENGEIYNLYENLESCRWTELALSESYELLGNIN